MATSTYTVGGNEAISWETGGGHAQYRLVCVPETTLAGMSARHSSSKRQCRIDSQVMKSAGGVLQMDPMAIHPRVPPQWRPLKQVDGSILRDPPGVFNRYGSKRSLAGLALAVCLMQCTTTCNASCPDEPHSCVVEEHAGQCLAPYCLLTELDCAAGVEDSSPRVLLGSQDARSDDFNLSESRHVQFTGLSTAAKLSGLVVYLLENLHSAWTSARQVSAAVVSTMPLILEGGRGHRPMRCPKGKVVSRQSGLSKHE
ncbi:hypothetical protein AC578_6271 [Pseudocercospora eumusae]|uniref:Uncharacterized protein n=1 Tax=Pseudocercospora eumusae TaxID=321146 RepID=A0A139H018_9PEZI|nr:hypothetical protein AC578_6271 [Pseudocercospora eumusae]